MNIQRLRNLTTGRLHTKMQDIYEDVEFLTGEKGVMTHQLPNAWKAMEPWLRDKIHDPRMWDGEFDITHTGEIDINPMTENEKKDMWERYGKLPSIFEKIGTGK